ncbi:MAG: chromate reductase [Flavobacteriaceae bacterium]|jgi:chromate reductase
MKRILALGASSSKKSINRQLADYAASRVAGAKVTLLDLNDFEMPIFSVDKEAEMGSPSEAVKFKQHIKDADGIIISFAEHNGSFSAAYKNIIDWTSRIEGKLWEGKVLFLLATSPGGRGGQTALASAVNGYPHMGGELAAQFSLPSFNANFNDGAIIDGELLTEFNKQLEAFQANL